MIVKYDEDNFSIKLYRDFVKGKLVGLMEVIPIEDLLDVWEKHKAEQTEPRVEAIQTSPRTECISRHYDFSDSKSFDERYGLFEPSTDCSWK